MDDSYENVNQKLDEVSRNEGNAENGKHGKGENPNYQPQPELLLPEK